MKYFIRDLIRLALILVLWGSALACFNFYGCYNMYESIKYFPFHLIVTIGYYAITSVCYKILLIGDCENEYSALIEEIETAKKFFTENKIKYN